jgi:inhibitor of KinA sporulation pathway (predicted exonuclease)
MRTIDLINVVDVEATCWPEGAVPHNQVSEIIEVGICTLNPHTLMVGQPKSLLIFPVDSVISPFCTALTTLTDDMIRASGIEFAAACLYLRQLARSRDRVWASFGDYDRNAFVKNCERRGIEYPFGPRHLNVKTLVALAFGWRHEFGMSEVLERLSMPLVGTHHRGGDDAYNIAQILRVVLESARGRI